jgi:hypothetical protein
MMNDDLFDDGDLTEDETAADEDEEIGDDEPPQPAKRTKRTTARARTIAPKELIRWYKKNRQKPEDADLPQVEDYDRPTTRADCLNSGINVQRPCPFVGCAHHLYLDVNKDTGAIKMNFPHLEVWELAESCALDVADRGGITLEEVGEIMNLTRERIRQVEVYGLARAGFEIEIDRGCHNCGSKMEEIEDHPDNVRVFGCVNCDRTIKEQA